jgi:hypothetical protein
MQVLGTPTREEIKCMNPNYTDYKFPQIKAHPWHKVDQTDPVFYLLFNLIYIFLITSLVFRSFPSELHQMLLILSQDFFSILLI